MYRSIISYKFTDALKIETCLNISTLNISSFSDKKKILKNVDCIKYLIKLTLKLVFKCKK